MQKDLTYIPSKESQDKIKERINAMRLKSLNFWQRRAFLEAIDKNYFGEVDTTRDGKLTKEFVRRGDIDKFVNVIVPVVLPHVESAVAFQNSMFLQGYPMFATAAPAKFLDAAKQMDAVIEDQQLHFGWIKEFQKVFRNAFKYNLAAMHCPWVTQKLFSPEGGEDMIYAGNKMECMDLYNTFWDPTVPPSEAHNTGEYAGFTKIFSTINMMRWLEQYDGIFNLHKAISTLGHISNVNSSYYVPGINSNTFVNPATINDTDWDVWFSGSKSKGSNSPTTAMTFGMHQVTLTYMWIIPRELGMTKGLENPNSVQLWRFILVNDETVVHAQRMNNAHNNIPIVVTQGIDDGLGYQTKSLAQNVEPMQQIATALFNAGIHARKNALSGTTYYDPTRVSKSDLESPGRNKTVQVKRSAFQKDAAVASAVHTPTFEAGVFQKDQQDLQSAMTMADQITGRNPARQGQFVKGNKTREEFSTIMGNSEGRDISTSMSLETSLMTPLKSIVKANILQYQDAKTLYNNRTEEEVSISPKDLRAANLTFKLADGMIPSSKMIGSEALSVAFQTLQSMPDIGTHYNTAGIFAYLLETQGANIAQFQKPEEMVAYEQAMAQWQQAVVMIAEGLAKLKDFTMEDVQEAMKQLPPQPTPEQFGWDPNKQLKDLPEGSVASKFLKGLGQLDSGQGNQQPMEGMGL